MGNKGSQIIGNHANIQIQTAPTPCQTNPQTIIITNPTSKMKLNKCFRSSNKPSETVLKMVS